jgi:signal transduction histidine kinase/DNA-binding response OmpR family regulator/ligand-binding sensor domain-containing protein
MRKLLVVGICLSLFYKAFSQSPERYFERISDQQGLHDLWINCLLQDKKGFIWIGGENGLYRFDGYNLVYIKDPPGCRNCPHFYPVYDMVEDDNGLLWTISYRGITIYDPEIERSWMAFRFNGTDSAESSFFFSKPLDLIKDFRGNIWATNENRLIRFSNNVNFEGKAHDPYIDPVLKLHTDLIELSQDTNSVNDTPLKMLSDSDGNIWVICLDALYVMRKGDTKFNRLEVPPQISSASITSDRDFLQDNNDTFFIVANKAVYIMENIKESLEGLTPDGSKIRYTKIILPGDQLALTLFKDKSNNIYIGSDLDIYKYGEKKEKSGLALESLYGKMFDKKDYSGSKNVQRIYQDRSGILWVGHQNFGLLKFNPDNPPFKSYNLFTNTSLFNLNINNLYFDIKGNLWMTVWGGGLFKTQKKTNQIIRYNLGEVGNRIVCMEEIRTGIFWLGLSHQGILEFNISTGRYYDPLPQGMIYSDIRASQINNILKDNSQIYLTTSFGIFVYDLEKKRMTQFSYPESNAVHSMKNWTLSPIRLKSGEIIAISKSYGIIKILYEAEKGNISVIPLISDTALRLRNIDLTYICRLYQDSNGSLWLCESAGLHKINLENKEIIDYKPIKDIEFPQVWSIIEDSHNNLWVGTHFGLCKVNMKTGQAKAFNREDGLPIVSHQYNSVCKDKDGVLYFGGVGGFYSFHPDSLKANSYIPDVAITDFRLFNKSVRVDTAKNGILTKSIACTNKIELQYDQNDISFEFAALDFTLPSRNRYSHKLEGYEDEWIETDAKNRVATYTNLDPGRYTFRVKGTNSDGLWNNDGTSVTVIIHKPWWGTNLAWVFYVLVILGIIAGYMRWRIYKFKKEKLYLERQVHERTLQVEEQKEKILSQRDTLELQNKQIIENEQLKSRFFTNISHEFRTPLSLIQSPVEEMLEDPRRNEKERRKLNMVHRNARRLLTLVNQLLDISKIDGNKMMLELIEDDIMKHLRAITGAFTSLAETKGINYVRHLPADVTYSWFDPDKLEKIASNLLSNAFKFTPDDGEIIFAARYLNSNDHLPGCYLEFSVQDNGPGIPSDRLEKIFDRFYQIEESVKSESGGTGIGLSLARDMARLMYGDIRVQSEPGMGSTFIVALPLGKDHLKESEFILLKEAHESVIFKPELHDNPQEVGQNPEEISKIEKPILLIVEDSPDIRMQLADNLNGDYVILEAIDGDAGVKKATEIIPDLIITDLMMPHMDGVELCDKLKNDELTSHIPIIMLTAKVTLEDKIAGLLTGADDYVPKPFHMAELKARVTNLIEQRRKLRERFSREVTLKPGDISITPLDEKFLNRAIEIVEKHINDETFGIREFREKMSMTRSTLFRKLQALTNQSPAEFIRIIRLKRAASLLKQNFGNISQVSYEVGFNNLTSFNRSFRKFYGVSPGEYKKKQI